MVLSSDVAKREIKEQDTGDPTVNRRVRLNVWVINHTLNVLCVDLDDEVSGAYNERPCCFECTKQSIELDLRLRVPLFTFVPGDRAKARWVPFLVVPHLRENKARSHPRGVDGENDLVRGSVIDCANGGACSGEVLERVHSLNVLVVKGEVNALPREVHEGLSMRRIAFNEHTDGTKRPQKATDLGERFAERPVEYDLEARVVDDSALIRAAVTNDEGSGSAEGGLGA